MWTHAGALVLFNVPLLGGLSQSLEGAHRERLEHAYGVCIACRRTLELQLHMR